MTSEPSIGDARQTALRLVSATWIELVKAATCFAADDSVSEATLGELSDSYSSARKGYKSAVRGFWASQPHTLIAAQTRALPRDKISRMLFLSRVRCGGVFREGDRMNVHAFRERFEVLVNILASVRVYGNDPSARTFFASLLMDLETNGLCPDPADE